MKKVSSSESSSISASSNTASPSPSPSLDNPFVSNMPPPIDPNMDINQMMSSLLSSLGAETVNTQSQEDRIQKQKDRESIAMMDRYCHCIFCVLFAFNLVFLPYDYDPNVFGFSLSSDPWTFFVAFELVIFSIFYGYKQYLHRQNQGSSQQTVLSYSFLLILGPLTLNA